MNGEVEQKKAVSSGGGLGTLSLHFEGVACRVGCEFCYLGARTDQSNTWMNATQMEQALSQLPYSEIAIALSEPIELCVPLVETALRVANERDIPVAFTTTLAVAASYPQLLARAARVSLSIDPRKSKVSLEIVKRAVAQIKAATETPPEIILIVTLITAEFAQEVIQGGLIEEWLAGDIVDGVALHGLKPPPPWCDRKFWLQAAERLAPILATELDRRFFLDCYVAARIFQLGDCPARADLSPATLKNSVVQLSARGSSLNKGESNEQPAIAFRSCVYKSTADFVTNDVAKLVKHTAGFVPPPVCPFPIV